MISVALSDWRSRTEFPADESPVFPSTVGTPINYSNLYNRVWIPARDAAGIPGDEYGAFHRLRKTLGTIVHGRIDKTDRQLADWLGHGDPAFSVRVYTGEMDDGLGKADFLDEAIPVEKWATETRNA